VKKILFLIPIYKHNPFIIVNKINFLYPNSIILFIDDGANILVKEENVFVYKNNKNLGLFKSLLIGYKESVKYNFDYIVRLDADNEYPIEQLNEMLKKINFNTAGVVAGFKRSIKMVGIIDFIFNKIGGIIEGYIILGKPFNQHSPALQIYNRNTVLFFLNNIEKLACKVEINWGFDLLVIKIASLSGDIVLFDIKNNNFKERRPVRKILSQMKSSIVILKLIKK
jgi:hypothetical protein